MAYELITRASPSHQDGAFAISWYVERREKQNHGKVGLSSSLRKACAAVGVDCVQLLVDMKERRIAIRPCGPKEPYAVKIKHDKLIRHTYLHSKRFRDAVSALGYEKGRWLLTYDKHSGLFEADLERDHSPFQRRMVREEVRVIGKEESI